jgi:hypothetical protein
MHNKQLHNLHGAVWLYKLRRMDRQEKRIDDTVLFSLALHPQFGPWPTSMKLSVSLRFSTS